MLRENACFEMSAISNKGSVPRNMLAIVPSSVDASTRTDMVAASSSGSDVSSTCSFLGLMGDVFQALLPSFTISFTVLMVSCVELVKVIDEILTDFFEVGAYVGLPPMIGLNCREGGGAHVFGLPPIIECFSGHGGHCCGHRVPSSTQVPSGHWYFP